VFWYGNRWAGFKKISGVGPRQIIDFVSQLSKKEAVFSLRMAILGAGKSLLEKRNDEMSGDKRHRIPFPNHQLAGRKERATIN